MRMQASLQAARDDGALVVVADSVRAQMFESDGTPKSLHEVTTLLNPEGRMRERDIVSDTAGRRRNRPTHGTFSAFGGASAKDHRIEEFAGRVCKALSQVVAEHPYRRLYIVAEPQFLGLLRRRMDDQVQRQVAVEVPKAMTGQPLDDVRELLPQRL